MDGKKMAKSAGNFQRVTELVDRGLDPLAFRYLVLTSRYSRKLEYSDRSIAAAAAASSRCGPGCARWVRRRPTDRGRRRPRCVAGAAGDRPGRRRHRGRRPRHRTARRFAISDRAAAPGRSPVRPRAGRSHERFVAAIDDDLDMPVALALLREILRAPIADDERRWLILDADAVLGLDLDRVWDERRRRDRATRSRPRSRRSSTRAPRPGPPATGAAPTPCGPTSRRLGWDVTDTPDGPELTRREARPGE